VIEVAGEGKLVEAIYEAVSLEVRSPPNPDRVWASSHIRADLLSIELYSRDISSLRAALNSYIYLIYTSLKSLKVSGKCSRSIA